MFPWLIFWAPRVHLPFGGNVDQQIEPNASWFFDAIPARAGDSTIERRAFEVASYGRQLGLLTELVTDMASQTPPRGERGNEALERLSVIQKEIDELKQRDATDVTREVETLIAHLKKRHKDQYPVLRMQIEQALAEGTDD